MREIHREDHSSARDERDAGGLRAWVDLERDGRRGRDDRRFANDRERYAPIDRRFAATQQKARGTGVDHVERAAVGVELEHEVQKRSLFRGEGLLANVR